MPPGGVRDPQCLLTPSLCPPGGLSLAVEGPSKAEITCQDNKDGTCTVSYLPTAPGDYNIIVRFDDKHIPGSPFTAKITGETGPPWSWGSNPRSLRSPDGHGGTCMATGNPSHSHDVPVHPWPPGPHHMAVGTLWGLGDTITWSWPAPAMGTLCTWPWGQLHGHGDPRHSQTPRPHYTAQGTSWGPHPFPASKTPSHGPGDLMGTLSRGLEDPIHTSMGTSSFPVPGDPVHMAMGTPSISSPGDPIQPPPT